MLSILTCKQISQSLKKNQVLKCLTNFGISFQNNYFIIFYFFVSALIFQFIKFSLVLLVMLRWAGHVAKMEEILIGKPTGKRRLGMLRRR